MNNLNKDSKNDSTWQIVVILIFLIIIYLAVLGKIDIENFWEIPNEFKETKEKAKIRHEKLKNIIEKQLDLKSKLENRFKNIYFSVRLGLVFTWFTLLFIIYQLGYIKNIGDILDFSEVSILVLLIINFLTFGTITKIEKFISIIKTKTENWVYGKYLNIEDKINLNKIEASELASKIELYEFFSDTPR